MKSFSGPVVDRFRLNFEKYILRCTPFKQKTDLFLMETRQFSDFGGGAAILKHHHGFVEFVEELYPHFLFDQHRFCFRNTGTAESPFYLDSLGQSTLTQISNYADWLAIERPLIAKRNAPDDDRLSVLAVLKRAFPQFFWEKVWKFPTFSDSEEKRIFIDELVLSSFALTSTHDQLLEIDKESLFQHPRGGTVLRVHRNSPHTVFKETYPELHNMSVKYHDGYWKKRAAIDKLLSGFPFVRTQLEFGSLTTPVLLSCPGGSSLLSIWNGSPQAIFNETYPELIPQRNGLCGLQMLMDKLILNFGFVNTQEDFLILRKRLLEEYPEGSTLLGVHNGSPLSLFQQSYPELMFTRKKMYTGYWKNLKKNSLFQKIIKFYDLKTKEDWYRISNQQIARIQNRVVHKKNMFKLLMFWLPEEDWNCLKLSEKNKKARQRYLGLKLREIFKGEVLFEDYLFKYEENYYIFDFYLPGLKLVIEYQGEQHYLNVLSWVSLEEQKSKDQQKDIICLQNNLKLVCVPYWWDGEIQFLKQLLLNH